MNIKNGCIVVVSQNPYKQREVTGYNHTTTQLK